MPIDTRRARELLDSLSRENLQRLFVEELNWANPARNPINIETAHGRCRLNPVAEQGGMVAFQVENRDGEGIPDRAARLAVHSQLLAHAQEHLLIFTNRPRTASVWTWVEREGGRRIRDFHHRYHVSQPGDSLLQKVQGLAFDWDDLDDEGKASIVTVTDRVRASLATEQVTRRFYDEFERRHGDFLDFIAGIEHLDDRRWYASVMLNRLMFIYFVQRKGFLDGDPAYLRTRLERCRAEGVPYYRGFLVPLFFEGLGTRPEDRSPQAAALLGNIPYLDGGLFMPHQVEQANAGIDIPDEAFERIYEFFDRYQWHLDDRPLRADNEINPDVLGYIFEKYINQKQMGAYYTKEDITEYICRNTVLPFLFDKLAHFRREAVEPLPVADVEPYIFEAMRKGVDLPLPPDIAAGLDDVSQRTLWNRAADPEFALPTETWREHIARRKHVQQIRDDFAAGRISTINDFITYNLDIVQFAQDFIADTDDPLALRAFYFECLKTVTVLDPTCGSGAFLFAALNILQPLYELCLQRMEEFLARRQRDPHWARPFEMELERLADHPSRPYFIYKSIIVNNLFGVDIMEEAVEICKLRLFLKLMAQVGDPARIEPLPDIDFNIRAGNTLVGYASLEDIERAKAPGAADTGKLDYGGIVDRVKAVDRNISTFRSLQMQSGISAQHFREAKENLRAELRELEAELNADLAFEYGVTKPEDLPGFVASHKPFHWYVEFYDILHHGGFDVIVGNPPYVEYSKVRNQYTVRGYETEPCGNLYAFVVERSCHLLDRGGRFGMIVPVAAIGLDKTQTLRACTDSHIASLWASSYAIRPSKLFEGVDQRLCIVLGVGQQADQEGLWGARYMHWYTEEREALFASLAYVSVTDAAPLGRIGKIGDQTGLAIIRKILAKDPVCATYMTSRDGAVLHYHRSPRYWIRAMDFEPHFQSATRSRSVHHFRDIRFTDEGMARFVGALMNSTTYYLWHTYFGNGRNIAESDFKCMPIGVPTPRVVADAEELLAKLMDDYRAHSRTTVRQDCEYQEFDPSKSKPIIDEIDRVLADHYGFTEEELDFIINYDIKYRMGGAEEGGEE